MARYQKLTIIGLIVVGLGLSLALLFLNLDSFVKTTIRFQDIFDITNIKTFFDNYIANHSNTYADF
jgi:hypothetical protein